MLKDWFMPFVSSRIHYCNALLAGIPSKTIQRLQYVQNSAARVLTKTRKTLHWFPEEKVDVIFALCFGLCQKMGPVANTSL